MNLGGWLVLERWMQESLFAGTEAVDEWSLVRAWGNEAERRLNAHYEGYITREDLEWLRGIGITAVRIPVGYQLVEGEPPYGEAGAVLSQALRWCDELGLAAVVDLHGAPGGQNGEHHSGRAGLFRWHLDAEARARTVEALGWLAARYGGHPSLAAIEVLNEPSPQIPAEMLLRFYRDAYRAIRQHCPAERVAVVVPAFPESRLPELHGRLSGAAFRNVVTDLHYYQCFGSWWEGLSVEEQLAAPARRRAPELRRWASAGPLLIGEWSLRLPWAPRDVAREASPAERDRLMRTFAAEQIRAYEATWGWFFWTYRTEGEPEWSFRECIERGWIEPGMWGDQ